MRTLAGLPPRGAWSGMACVGVADAKPREFRLQQAAAACRRELSTPAAGLQTADAGRTRARSAALPPSIVPSRTNQREAYPARSPAPRARSSSRVACIPPRPERRRAARPAGVLLAPRPVWQWQRRALSGLTHCLITETSKNSLRFISCFNLYRLYVYRLDL